MALVLLILLHTFFTVFGEEILTLPPTSSPSHTPSPHYHPPTHSPLHPPHHHHHHHPPAFAPSHSPPSPTSPPPIHHHQPPTQAPSKPPTHHHHPPTQAPSKPPIHHHPPTHAPSKPPTHHHYPPTPPPRGHPSPPAVHHLPRTFVAVQGVVYVKPCKYAGVDTLLGATPVLGAVVKLQCNNTKYKLVQTAKTDKNGYFFLEAPKTITTYGVHKCNVVLVSAPNGLKPSNLHGGVTGAILRPEKPYVSFQKFPFLLYTAGPLAFEPKCPHH